MAYADPPQLLQIVREPIKAGSEVWWFNCFESEAERLQVSSAYQRNQALMEVLVRNSEKKSKYTGKTTDMILTYRPDLGRGARWDLSGARFVVATIVKGAIHTEGSVFSASDGTCFVVQPVRTQANAEQLAGDPRAIVLAIRASWGMPAKQWVDADRDFWNVNPAAAEPAR